MKRIGELMFAGAFVLALALYGLTMPDGLPWNDSTHLALAYLDEIVRLPSMPHPFWGFYVQVFGSPVILSVFMSAIAAGLIATLVCRYLGWRFAASAAIVWIFLPGVWNRAVTGERGICLAAMAVIAAWVLNAVVLRVLRKARSARRGPYGWWRSARARTVRGDVLGATTSHEGSVKSGKVNRIAGWAAMGVTGLFALVSLTLHDYRLGEAASAFARGVVESAGDRIIVLNDVCDDQMIVEAKARALRTVSLRTDDLSRSNLVAWARSAFPAATNLWVAAQVSPRAFLDTAVTNHPDAFYLTNGRSTTLEALERRWEAFAPYLKTTDPFVRVARRTFGNEANAVANALLDGGGKSKAEVEVDSSHLAWRLYKRIYEEIDPGNLSALVNQQEMIRRGYAVSKDEQKRIRETLEAFFTNAKNRERAREIVRESGPIRTDPRVVEEMRNETRNRLLAKIAAGEKIELPPEVLSLIERSNEMCRLMNEHETVKAGRIARAILSKPEWQKFIPANAVMGTVAAQEGDYVASERFFEVATSTTNAVAPIVLNDYADTLMHLGKLEQAEKIARRAVKETDEDFWVVRVTLAEVLEKKGGWANGGREEIKQLLKSALKRAPAEFRERIRQENKHYLK